MTLSVGEILKGRLPEKDPIDIKIESLLRSICGKGYRSMRYKNDMVVVGVDSSALATHVRLKHSQVIAGLIKITKNPKIKYRLKVEG